MRSVIARAVVTGAVAGGVAGVAPFVVLVVAAPLVAAFGHGTGGADVLRAMVSGVGFVLAGAVVGVVAGSLLALPTGLALGLLRPRLTGRRVGASVAGALLSPAPVALVAGVCAGLGMSRVWLAVVFTSPLLVAALAGALRGRHLVDGPPPPPDPPPPDPPPPDPPPPDPPPPDPPAEP